MNSLSLNSPGFGSAPAVRQFTFGTLPEGEVTAIDLENGHGLSATLLTFGATLRSLALPDALGNSVDVLLGHQTLGEYAAGRQYLGATVGRFANRIAGGRFTLDGAEFAVPPNDGPNALHGGVHGFDRVLWELLGTGADEEKAWVRLGHHSADGDQGFPGALDVEARFELDIYGALTIDYRAKATRSTVVNITNHAYWNLAGESSGHDVFSHRLMIPADCFLPVDQELIPLSGTASVDRTPFDFRRLREVRLPVNMMDYEQLAITGGYDHNWVVSKTKHSRLQLMAKVSEPQSGRGFTLWSNQPGLQFYSGNFLDGSTRGKSGQSYSRGAGFVLEPQIVPNAPNRLQDLSSALVEPGDEYRNLIVYRFET